MTFTNDERSEIVELMRGEAADFRRLREEYDGAWTVDLGDVPAIFQDITHYVGLDGVVRDDEIFDRLADLIDPTCHIMLRQSDSDLTDEPHYLCSRCGKEAVYVYERRDYTLAGIVSHARYCSYCVARVVDE